jgi:hypothetical protein
VPQLSIDKVINRDFDAIQLVPIDATMDAEFDRRVLIRITQLLQGEPLRSFGYV